LRSKVTQHIPLGSSMRSPMPPTEGVACSDTPARAEDSPSPAGAFVFGVLVKRGAWIDPSEQLFADASPRLVDHARLKIPPIVEFAP
jgi:hypothetical protein